MNYHIRITLWYKNPDKNLNTHNIEPVVTIPQDSPADIIYKEYHPIRQVPSKISLNRLKEQLTTNVNPLLTQYKRAALKKLYKEITKREYKDAYAHNT